MSREIVNSVLLLWGSLFCAVSSLYFWITKNYRTETRGWIYRMQVSTSVLLFCDAMTNLFRGRPDLLVFWMVRISNFFNFFLVNDFCIAQIDIFHHGNYFLGTNFFVFKVTVKI